MATACGGPATKIVTQPSHPFVQSSSSSRGQRIALLPSCKLSGLRIGGQNGGSHAKKERRGDVLVVRMGIRAVESFDATFQLTAEVKAFSNTELISCNSES